MFPETMSAEAKHLIISLLEKNPMIRLGATSVDG